MTIQPATTDADGGYMVAFRWLMGLAATAAAIGASITSAAHAASVQSPPLRTASSSLHARVSKPGLYSATLRVSTRTPCRGGVELTIGKTARHVVIVGGRSRAPIQLLLAVRVHRFAVQATDDGCTVTMRMRLRRVAAFRSKSETPAAAIAVVAPRGASTPRAHPTSSGGSNAGAWKLIFDDEFAGTTLNSTDWTPGWQPSLGITADLDGVASPDCYDPAEDVVANGELDLNLVAKSDVCDGATEPYATGFISTYGKFSFTYGFAEARIWLPAAPDGSVADWPAFWATGTNWTEWPTDGENDVLEGLSPAGNGTAGEPCFHFHYGVSRVAEQSEGECVPGSFAGGWHTFGSDWESGSITYFYDGVRVGRTTGGITNVPMFLILTLEPGAVATNPNGGEFVAPATMRVDYVRVWQH